MGHKKTNEAWFGDTFNRPYSLSFMTADGQEHACAVNSMTIEHDLDGSCSMTADIGSIFASAGTSASPFEMAKGVSISSDVDSFKRDIADIQARIADLERQLQPKTRASELRSALKTLAYNREI